MDRMILTNVNLIDVETGARPGATIIVEGERIAAVEFGPYTRRGPEERVVDAQGCSVIPGMFNCHYHASYHNVSAAAPAGMEAPIPLQTLRASRNLRLALNSGFTSVVSAGAPFAIDASLKAAVEEGTIQGPRITAGSRDISTTGHSQDMNMPWWWEGAKAPGVVLCDSPDEFRKAVRDEVKRGSEIIKVFVTEGHGVKGVEGQMDLFEPELAAIVETAHQRGAKVRGHISNKLGVMTCLRLGFDVIDHGDGLDEEGIELFLKTGAFLIPSMLFPHRVAERRPGPVADAMKITADAMLKVLPIANKAGVKILLGDDFGALKFEHGEYADELDYYVNIAGIPALDVLRWATKTGSELVDRPHELGQVKPGFLADFVVVDGDPLADIRVLKDKSKLKAVLKGGAFMKDELDSLAAPGRQRNVA